jgi:hypothetical protein
MTKIIGFLITKEDNIPDIDFFDVGLNIVTVKHNGYNIYLWGVGKVGEYIIEEKYSLSFPLHASLLDRNILISFNNEEIIVENDWLGSIPVFYNIKENIVSTLSNLCIKDKTIHPEGLSNFCEYGYSLFEQTMFEDIKFMRFYSKLIISDKIEVYYKKDPVLEPSFLKYSSSEEEVIQLMEEYVASVENRIDGEIILPTSGGYDSRLLNYLVRDKSKIRSFTYGISRDQSQSTEVIYAKKISEIYNTKWEQIELKKFHDYIDKWVDIYGISTHLHGMYHIEFYQKIFQSNDLSNASFLSGIGGDWWNGKIVMPNVLSFREIEKIAYFNGMNLDIRYLKVKKRDDEDLKKFFEDNAFLLSSKYKNIVMARLKFLLISYLLEVPEYFGLPAWTPFLNYEIVKATLNLPEGRRKEVIWQKDFFKKVGLNLEEMGLKSNKSNNLNYEITQTSNLEPINVELMKHYIDERRLIEINRVLSKLTRYEAIKHYLLSLYKIGGALRRLGVKGYLNTLYDYYVIKVIEKGLTYNERS